MNKSESVKELATALCNFQSAVEKIKKTEENPFFKSKYASLSDILNVIRKPLADNGLSFVQFPSGKYGLDTMLLHTSGEWISESYEMEPTKHDPQGAGSVITYQRRYALGAILGLNIDEDDDANKASATPSPEEIAEKANIKPWLNPNTPQFTEAIKFLKEGGILSKIQTKYRMSQKTIDELLNAAME